MASYMWSPKDLKIIQDYQTWLEDESTRTRTLRENGPTGQPWPKRPKCARVLDDVQRNTRQILSGEKLHQYLIQNCAEDEFVTIPPQPRDGYETLEDMKSRLIAEWSIVRKHGRKSLNAYIDFGLLLRQAFALHQTEKDSGLRRESWKTWLQNHVKISEAESRKCREMAALLAPYPRLRKLSLAYTEVFNRREQLRSLLESNDRYGSYWKQQ